VVVLVLITALSRILAMEDTLGVSAGHPETLALVEQWLDDVEPL
jgi:hypothetical protein